jgi:hypothetical protein
MELIAKSRLWPESDIYYAIILYQGLKRQRETVSDFNYKQPDTGITVLVNGDFLTRFRKEIDQRIDEYIKGSVEQFLEDKFDEKYPSKDVVLAEINKLIDEGKTPETVVVYRNGLRWSMGSPYSPQDKWTNKFDQLKQAVINDLFRPIVPVAPQGPIIQISAGGNIVFVPPLQ